MYAAASPVSAAIFALLQASATLVQLTVGGIHDDLPSAPDYPCVLNEVFSEIEQRGLGAVGFPLIEFRTHVFSTFGGLADAQEINRLIIAALRDQPLTIAGYAHAGLIFYDETVPLADQEINGVKVHEIVSLFRIYAEESA